MLMNYILLNGKNIKALWYRMILLYLWIAKKLKIKLLKDLKKKKKL